MSWSQNKAADLREFDARVAKLLPLPIYVLKERFGCSGRKVRDAIKRLDAKAAVCSVGQPAAAAAND